MRATRSVFGFSVLTGLIACGNFSGGDLLTPSGPDSQADAGAPPAPPPLPPGAPPVTTGTPTKSELTEEYGFFVSAKGSDTADGTRLRPLASIAAAIAKAKASAKRVYVCQGTYKEAVALENAVSVVGGLDCSTANWGEPIGRTRIESPTSPALRARDILNPTRFDGFEVIAPEGTADAPSSLAMIAERASALTVANTKLEARTGFDGADGTDPADLRLDGSPGGAGQADDRPFQIMPGFPRPIPYQRPDAAVGGTATCAGAGAHPVEAGGRGGRGARSNCIQLAIPAQGNRTAYFWRVTDVVDAAETPSGRSGASGKGGASGREVGVLTPNGYSTADGTAGTDGEPGAGGRGGTGMVHPRNGTACTTTGDDPDTYHFLDGAYGAGGGHGGCEGLAGTPGKGGGGSIGALLFTSPQLTFERSEIASSKGGRGGKGTLGSVPTVGGSPGADPGNTGAQPGGAGGPAGVSGSGGGGPSFAIAHTGGEPKLVTTNATAGEGGAGAPAQERRITLGNREIISALAASPNGASESVHAF